MGHKSWRWEMLPGEGSSPKSCCLQPSVQSRPGGSFRRREPPAQTLLDIGHRLTGQGLQAQGSSS